MIPPQNRVHLSLVSEGLWQLDREVVYVTRGGMRIVVPRGMMTDLASVPPLFWSVLPEDGLYVAAAVVHDWLYRCHRTNRPEADAIFLEIMVRDQVPAWKRQAMYWAVRIFGATAWAMGGAR